jgi:hypothetical protein
MFKVNLFIALLAAGMSFQNVYADNINSALQKTQDCLKSQNCDSALTEAGKMADLKALEAVAGNASNKQELYNIAAGIMPILAQQATGDPAKMQDILFKAQTDPVKFLNSLPPEIQAKIKNAANAVDKNQTPR